MQNMHTFGAFSSRLKTQMFTLCITLFHSLTNNILPAVGTEMLCHKPLTYRNDKQLANFLPFFKWELANQTLDI